MHFSKRGDFYQAAYVSGPRHVFLAVAFAGAPVERIIEAVNGAGLTGLGPVW